MDYVITTVHGTFARRAPWTRPDSPLCRKLMRVLPGDVLIAPFDWSGRNTTGARTKAAAELRKHLHRLFERYQDAKHFVITHSHGGNVVLYAMRDDPAVRDGITGVACLATPFLHANPRDLGPNGERFIITAPVVILMVLGIGLRARFVPEISSTWWALGIAVLVLIAMFFYVKWDQFSKRLREGLAFGDLPTEKVNIFRVTGDEASGLLLTGHFLSALTTRIFAAFARWSHGAELRYQRRRLKTRYLIPYALGLATLGFGISFILVWRNASTNAQEAARIFGAVGVIFILWQLGASLTLVIRFLVSLLIVPLALILSLVLVLPYGPRIAAMNILLDVTAEATPPGTWRLHQLPPEPLGESNRRSVRALLAHSGIYNDRRVHRRLIRWICGA